MAQKRMFSKMITNSDGFLEMPDSSQNLYFHLSMNADDDGFINNWKSIMRMTGHKEDDLKVLIAKSFIIPFESGVIVIKHWRINNYLRNDRYVETKFKDEKNSLFLDDNMVYQLDTNGIPNGNPDKIRLDKNRLDENRLVQTTTTNNLYEIVERNFGRTLSPIEIQKIDEWSSSFDEEIIDYAITIATLNNKRTFNYVNGILKNWKTAGYKTLVEIKENEDHSRKYESTLTEEQKKNLEEVFDYNWLEDDSWEGEE